MAASPTLLSSAASYRCDAVDARGVVKCSVSSSSTVPADEVVDGLHDLVLCVTDSMKWANGVATDSRSPSPMASLRRDEIDEGLRDIDLRVVVVHAKIDDRRVIAGSGSPS